jgi:hypothetical protein
MAIDTTSMKWILKILIYTKWSPWQKSHMSMEKLRILQ